MADKRLWILTWFSLVGGSALAEAYMMPAAATGISCSCDPRSKVACSGALLIQFSGQAQLTVTTKLESYVGYRTAQDQTLFNGFGWIVGTEYPTDVVVTSSLQSTGAGSLQLADSVSHAVLATFTCKPEQ